MAPSFAIDNVRNTGPTDNSGDDTLYVVELHEHSGESETVRFTVARTYGVPSEKELRELIAQRAAGFVNERGAVEQFRECEIEHPPGSWRRAVVLRPRVE